MLMGHPLLKLDQLVALGRRLATKNSVRWRVDARPDSSFYHAPESHKAQWGAEMTLERISEAKAWMSLRNLFHLDLGVERYLGFRFELTDQAPTGTVDAGESAR